jgi:hypothetical protein
MAYIEPSTVPVPEGTIALHPDSLSPGNQQACGECGAVVAYGHVARHIAWHAELNAVNASLGTVVRGPGQMGP